MSFTHLFVSFTSDQRHVTKSDHLKFSDGSSKLLSGHKFQDKYVALHADKLLLYRDIKVSADGCTHQTPECAPCLLSLGSNCSISMAADFPLPETQSSGCASERTSRPEPPPRAFLLSTFLQFETRGS